MKELFYLERLFTEAALFSFERLLDLELCECSLPLRDFSDPTDFDRLRDL